MHHNGINFYLNKGVEQEMKTRKRGERGYLLVNLSAMNVGATTMHTPSFAILD